MDPKRKNMVILAILDGWGYDIKTQNNAVALAKTPQWDHWWRTRPHILLHASGSEVGLPKKQMGNSEVGHMHIGAGRIINQDLTKINTALENGTFENNRLLSDLFLDLKQKNKHLHVLGLFSNGGVHSHQNHLFMLLKMAFKFNYNKILLHLFLDGRDTAPKSALKSFKELDKVLKIYPVARVASISGRYYAMDRDKRWTRTAKVYNLLTEGKASQFFKSAVEALNFYYQQGINDEFIPPTIINKSGVIKDDEAVFFFNFRADRARQLCEVFLNPEITGLQNLKKCDLYKFITLTSYGEQFPFLVVFPTDQTKNTLGEVVAAHHLKQLRIAETEKYAHVTFFLNGGIENKFAGEDRILVPSPKVATYDLAPEMSAPIITEKILQNIEQLNYDLIICNFANADMVGHTGKIEAAIKAIECLDKCMQKIGAVIQKVNGHFLITSDHGNAESMYNEKLKQPHTAHTCSLVPLLYAVGSGWKLKPKLSKCSLTDIAPTILNLLNLPIPIEMTGSTLLIRE